MLAIRNSRLKAEEEFQNYSSDDGHVAYSSSSTHTDGASNFSSTSRVSSSSVVHLAVM